MSLARPFPEDEASHYEDFFGCDVLFGAPETSISFDSQLLKLPLVGADPQLAQSYDQLTEQYIAKPIAAPQWVSILKKWCVTTLW